MDCKSIVLNSISCKGVKCFTLFQKSSVYAVVSIAGGGDGRKSKQLKHKTSADHEGGENPEWDQTMQFDLDCRDFQDRFLEFRFMAQGNVLLGDKLIGNSRVLMADLIEGQPSGGVRHVSYQVQSPDGKPNGVLSFSYRLNLEIAAPPPLDRAIPSAPLCDDYRPPSAPDYFASVPSSAPRESLYPPLPFPESAPPDGFFYPNQQTPLVPANYYTPPPPPPPPSVEYYHPSERSVYTPVSARDTGYLYGHAHATREYYPPPPATLPPPPAAAAFGSYYPPPNTGYPYPPPSGYSYPPPQDSCSYCNCK